MDRPHCASISLCIHGFSHSQMAEKIGLIPEMLLEILSRLPIKSLARFKCVSKSWLFLINRNLGWKAVPSTMLGFFYVRSIYYPKFHCHPNHKTEKIRSTNLHFLPCSFNTPEIVDSCNGLLLCRPMILIQRRKSVFYYVCNPATRRWDKLPPIPYNVRDFARLAFDPHVSFHYKVLWVKRCGTHSEFNVFSSESHHGSWQKIVSPQPIIRPGIYGRCCGLYSKGALYMASRGANGGLVVRYRLLEGTSTTIMLPADNERTPFIGILGGSTCYAKLAGSHLKIWTLIEHDNVDAWVLKDDIIVEETEAVSPALAFHPLLEVVFLQTKQGFFSYDLSCSGGAAVNIGGPASTQQERNVGVALPFTPCYKDELKGMINLKKQGSWLPFLCFVGFLSLPVYLWALVYSKVN